MELFETATYSPQQHAFFPHSSHPLLSLHASSRYFSFQTRTHELILADTSTGRMIVLYKAQHAFECSVFTHDYLLAAHQTCHQVLVFSLKAGKLKSRLTGHLADLHTLAYCRQTDQIASLSSQFCFIHAQKTLVHVKTIKCSTSSFVDCQFALTGSLFATSFKDGSVLLWDPVSWNHRSSAVIERSPRVALGDGNILAVYSPKKLWLSDTTQQITTHEQAQSFWEGEIKQIVFIDNMLVLSGTDCTYVAQVNQTHNLRVQKLRKLELVSACVAHTQYQSTLVSLSTDLRKISVFSLLSTNANITKRTNNPLTNEGLVCAGGYDKSQGCHVANQIVTNNNYSPVQMAIEPLTQACYAQIPNSMNLQQLKRFLLKNHTLPDKYRPIAYRHALKLPISPQQFRQLQRKGLHPSTQLLGNKYPLPNKELSQSMRQVMSLLAHWQGVIGESELVPPIVFGFVCLFGKDIFFCFQVLVRLFVGPLSFLFTQFPLANSQLLQNLWQILKGEDEELCRHFQKNSIRFTRLAWGLLGSFFTSVMSRQNFLAIADLVLVRADEPELVLFVCLSYLIFNRKRLLSANDEDSAGSLCQQEQTLHIGKFLTLVGKLHSKWHKKVRYGLKVWLQRGHYQNISVPKEAVLMHEQRRNVLVEQLQKQKENEAQREKMLKQMQKMVVNARRQAERQLLESQAYQLHSQQQNNPIHLQPIDRSSRIQKLQSLINQLTVALERQQLSRDQVRQYVPALQLVKVASDSTLDQLELKLLQVLGEVRPSNSLRPFLSQPANLVKLPADKTGLQGAVGARLAGNLWEMDQLYNKGHASKWENCMLAATQK